MTLGIIFGLLASFCTGLSLVFVKKSYEEFPASIAFAFQTIFGLLVWIPFAFFIGITFKFILFTLAIALLSAILSEAFYYYIFQKADVGITGAVFSTYPLFTILFSFLFLSERPPSVLFLFALVIVVGIIILSLPDKIQGVVHKNRAIFWGLVGAGAVGFSDTISKGIIDQTSAATFLFALAIMQIPVALIFLRRQNERAHQFLKIFSEIQKYKYAIIGAFLGVVAVLFLWLTFEVTYASIASPLTGAYPLFTLLLAYVWLKEKLSLRDWIGSLIIIAGVLGMSTII